MLNQKSLRFDILTLFPNVVDAYCGVSILKRAQERNVVKIVTHQLRDFTTDKHHTTDEPPYGGGAGMVLKAEPILRAVEKVSKMTKVSIRRRKVIVLSAKGKLFTQKLAYEFSKKYDHLVLVSGRYEGIDERVKTILRAEEISIGPYVTTDGDVGAMVLVSAITRLLPGVIRWDSLQEESHWNETLRQERKANLRSLLPTTLSRGDNARRQGSRSAKREHVVGETPAKPGSPYEWLEYPHYTRPEVFVWKGKKYRVPKVLLTGNHKNVEDWRRAKRRQA